MSELRRLAWAENVFGVPRFADHQVIAVVAEMIRSGRLRICGRRIGAAERNQCEVEASDQSAEAARTVVRILHARAPDLGFEGHRLRFATASEWSDLRGAGHYETVPRDEAIEIVHRMIASPQFTSEYRGALQKAEPLLPGTGTARPSSGLLLLRRRAPAMSGRGAGKEAAITPSQARRIAEREVTHWVEYRVVDRAGKPIGGVPYALRSPGGQIEKAKLASSGRIRRDGCEAGSYLLDLGELTSACWVANAGEVTSAVPASTKLTMVVQTAGLDPGLSGQFEVFHLCEEEPGSGIAKAGATVGADGKIAAEYSFSHEKVAGRQVDLVFSCRVDKLWIKSPVLTLRLPRLVAPLWGAEEVFVGDTVSLAVSCPGIADGETASFEIRRLDTNAVVETVFAPVIGESARAEWKSADPDPDTPETELCFVARCSGLQVRSRPMILKDRIELVFEDDLGQPLSFLRVRLEYADGTVRAFQTDGDGVIRLTDPRAMKAKASIAGAEEADVQTTSEVPI